MRLATVDECRKIDEISQTDYHLLGETLMEAAGVAAAKEIEQSFIPELKQGTVVIVCGPGNNGGDGLVVARQLHSAMSASANASARATAKVTILLVAPRDKRSALFSLQLERCEAQGIEIVDWFTDSRSNGRIESASLIVDAIFGIGLRSEVREPFREVIELINSSKAEVVSLDIPSGLDGDRGVINGAAVKASMTLTFGLAKPGFFVSEGPSQVGRLRILKIGFPQELVKKIATTRFAFTESMAFRALPRRKPASNKTNHGHALIFAGSTGMWGAGVLAASSAYRSGAGYVTLASHQEPLETLREWPEFLTAKATDDRLWQKPKWSAAAIGPGLGVNKDTYLILEKLLASGAENVVVDADALTVIASEKIASLPANWVLTPHAGELSRLLQVPAKDIESDRYRYAVEAAAKFGCVVLLKGYRTVVARSDKAHVILAGNSSLAKAGTGDVLTGILVGFMAQGMVGLKAAATAAYIHGRMSDEWVRSGHDQRSLQASDLREFLPRLLQQLARAK